MHHRSTPGLRAVHHGAWRPLLAVTGLALLSACGGGGGGGGDDTSTERTLAITSANRDAVAQIVAGTVMGVGNGLGAVGLNAPTDQASQRLAAARRVAGNGLLPAPLQRALREQLGSHRRGQGMKRALAVVGPVQQLCTYGGSTSVTLDDADNNGDLSAGDTVSMRFTNCAEEPGVTVSGEVSLQLTGYVELPRLRVNGRMVFTALTARDADGALTMDGTLGFEMVDVDDNTDRMTITAQTPVVSRLSTGVVTDTATLGTGYQQTEVFEYTVQAPDGRFSSRSTVNLSGVVAASGLGGQFSVSTLSPVVRYTVEDYPRAGALQVQGRTGLLRLTVLNPLQVRLELDADDNGSFESSTTVNWSWLL